MIQTQLKLSIVPDAIMTAYNELDIEELVQNEKDDQQVVLLLQEFEEASDKEMAKRNEDIGFKEVRKNAKYQQFLEVLDQYYDRPGEKVEKEETGVAEPVPEVSEVLDVSSEGLEALNEYLPTTDPFTKMTLKDPYINRICKHVYEYQSVMDMMITSGNKTRCPYVGCSNKKYILPDDLVKDPVIAAKIIERVQDEICGVYMTVD
ncbi:E3 SUMO-protein ligase NSE2 [Orchesella cincta]|uniref:E3 SUMO-protein ligase NSE2 n=1 Tax=Orchesella cincta TaxID=48709 RepID=A0A1D2MKY0_ORCCI|nr:E3 SUMO-protein ligase NSE2 [Orchesella cincta]